VTVHRLDSVRGLIFTRETNEGEPPWPPRVTVGWDVNVHDFAHLGEQLAELLIRNTKVEITYENLV
jgi:hypothetical protein